MSGDDAVELTLPGAILALRKTANMSATVLARELDVRARQIHAYEENGVPPGPERLFKLAILADLFSREDLYWIFVRELKGRFIARNYGIEVTRRKEKQQTK